MKRIAMLLAALLCAALLPSCAPAQTSEGAQIAAAIDRAYPGVQIDQLQRWGGAAAAVFAHDGQNVLCMLEQDGEHWRMTVNNPSALLQDQPLPSLRLDSDNAVFWSYDLGRSSFGAFKEADGSWGRVSQLYRETVGDRLVEHEILLRGGRLVHSVGVYDENENPLEPWRTQAELPAAFLETCIALADFDAARFPVYAAEEYAGQWPPRAFIAECAQELLPGYAFAGGSVQDGTLQLLMDDPQGARVFAAAGESGVIISAPLPSDTVYGVENFTSSLGIGGLCVTMGQYEAGGQWGVRFVLSAEGELLIGRRCVFEAHERDVMRFGDHPWSDMQTIDWDTLPASFEEAKAHVKPDGWAIVANPDPADRLHLRERADRGSASLGKYYNGTPVRVIALEGDWAQVVVGETPGYMMKKYLRLNDGGAVGLAPMPDLQARAETLMLYEAADTASRMEEIAAQRDMRVIGIVSDSFYHVWFPDKEKYGYVSADALWPGNG